MLRGGGFFCAIYVKGRGAENSKHSETESSYAVPKSDCKASPHQGFCSRPSDARERLAGPRVPARSSEHRAALAPRPGRGGAGPPSSSACAAGAPEPAAASEERTRCLLNTRNVEKRGRALRDGRFTLK